MNCSEKKVIWYKWYAEEAPRGEGTISKKGIGLRNEIWSRREDADSRDKNEHCEDVEAQPINHHRRELPVVRRLLLLVRLQHALRYHL